MKAAGHTMAWPRGRVITGVLAGLALPVLMVAPAQASGARGLAAPARSHAAHALAAPVRPAPARGLASPTTGITFPLHTSGANIVDAAGKQVKLDLVNWYGGESPDYVVGGLAYQPINAIINEIVSMGFNGVRLPWSNQMWESNPAVSAQYVAANPQFAGEPARTVFQQVVQDLANAGLMVVLDNHNSNAEWCCSATDGNTLWYNSAYPQSAWLSDWQSMVSTFAGVPQVIGADLRNEPRGSAAWGGGNSSLDWHAAAQQGGNSILGMDPHWLIFVEGTNYGLDLSGAGGLPVTLSVANQLVYSVHDYGFDFSGLTNYDSWASAIQSDWGYLVGKDPLWVGEFGTCDTAATCVSSTSSSDNGLWFSFLTRFLRYHDVSWSYWAVNGTESDGLAGQGRTYGATETYGVLNPGWSAAASPALLSGLQSIQPGCAAAPLASGTYTIKNRTSGDVIDLPGGSTTQGTDLDQWPANGGTNQQWKVTSLGCGLYSITSVADGQSVDISGQSTSQGAKVDQWGYWGGGNQQFLLAKNSAGYYTITNLNSLDVVEVPGSSTTAGTDLDQWGSNGGNNQQWSFTAG
jgi:endoglucanase